MRLRRLDLRFTSPVYPGEPLQVDMWRIGDGDAAFRLMRRAQSWWRTSDGSSTYGTETWPMAVGQ